MTLNESLNFFAVDILRVKIVAQIQATTKKGSTLEEFTSKCYYFITELLIKKSLSRSS